MSSKKSGSDVSDVYNPKWQFYPYLLFLRNNFTRQATETNLKRSFSGNNTAQVQSILIKRDIGVEAIIQLGDSMKDMATTIHQKRDAALIKTENPEDKSFAEMMTKITVGTPEL